MAIKNCLVFRINQSLYAVDVGQAGEIEKKQEFKTLPGMPSCLLGFIEIRNEAVPVISVREQFELNALKAEDSFDLIVTKLKGHRVAYQVDSVYSITVLNFQEKNEAPELVKSTTGCVQQVIELDGQVVILLDLDKLLTEQSKNQLCAYIEDMEQSTEENK